MQYQYALRAYRQLASVLRDQGLYEEADHFAYQAHCLRQTVLKWKVLRKPVEVKEHRWLLHFLLWRRHYSYFEVAAGLLLAFLLLSTIVFPETDPLWISMLFVAALSLLVFLLPFLLQLLFVEVLLFAIVAALLYRSSLVRYRYLKLVLFAAWGGP